MHNENRFTILLVDNDTEFHRQIFETLNLYSFNVMQVFNKVDTFNFIQKATNNINLIILNLEHENSIEIFEYIQEHTDIKIILFSNEDNISQRESYFSKGILDFHLTNRKIEYIIDDIIETINSLESNKQETILIIDNSKELCDTLQNILEARNYKILTATKATEGLEILRENEISLLILDMNIKDINSLDLLDGLRDLYLLNDFFVLALSDINTPSSVRDVLKSGAKDFIKKPFLYEEFILKADILTSSSRSKKTIVHQTQEIKDNLKTFKELLDASIGGMFVFENSICINCNNEAITLLGLDSKEYVIGKILSDIFPDISEEHKQELCNNDTNYHFEDNIVIDDKTIYEVEFKERNINIGKQPIKIIAVMDITDVKRKEQILAHQSKMASMGEMLGNIAHQWRQPLTAISIAASGIKLNYELEMEDKDETIEELDNIVANTKFLSTTIESFQNFFKTNRKSEMFYLRPVIEKTLAIIHANLRANNIKIITNYELEVKLEGIENEIVQVFLNIINNAVDILKTIDEVKNERYIFISVYSTEDEILISIKDNANGVPIEVITNIFEPYFTTKHQSDGTGLGLYMSHQIIEKLGGSIKVVNEKYKYNSKSYKGANFKISFPKKLSH